MSDIVNKLEKLCFFMKNTTFDDVEEKILVEFEDTIDLLLLDVNSHVLENDLITLCHYASVLDVEYEDFARMLFDVIWESEYYPNNKIWRVEPFSDLLQEIKQSMQTKNNTNFSELYIPFSFGNFDVNNIDEVNKIVSMVDVFDKFDIDNTIGNIDSYKLDEIIYPKDFENRLILSIEREGYSIDNYHVGSSTLYNFTEKHHHKVLERYFEVKKDESTKKCK